MLNGFQDETTIAKRSPQAITLTGRDRTGDGAYTECVPGTTSPGGPDAGETSRFPLRGER